MNERFTGRARQVLLLADKEARGYNHLCVGTEHILLGLVKEGSGVAANVLRNLDVDLHKLRTEVEKIVQSGPPMVTKGTVPHTPRAKTVLEYAIEEARNLNHNYVGTEHLLLGLLREQKGVAAQALMNLGLKLEVVRTQLLDLLSSQQKPSGETIGSSASVVRSPESFRASKPLRLGWRDLLIFGKWRRYERFTTPARNVMRLANKEALRCRHEDIGTEHILLGLLDEAEARSSSIWIWLDLGKKQSGIVVLVLEFLGLDPDQVRQSLAQHLQIGPLPVRPSQLPLTPRAQKALDYAIVEADMTSHRRVGPEQLLLGLLQETEGVAAHVLANLGVSLETVRQALGRLQP